MDSRVPWPEMLHRIVLHYYLPQGQADLWYLLNAREKDACDALDAQFREEFPERGDPRFDLDLVYFLGDSPSYKTWSALTDAVPTFRLNAGVFWFPAARRWLTPVDKLSCLTLPVTPDFAASLGTPMLGARDLRRAATLIGNSMHLLNVAIVQMVALSCFAEGPNPQPPA